MPFRHGAFLSFENITRRAFERAFEAAGDAMLAGDLSYEDWRAKVKRLDAARDRRNSDRLTRAMLRWAGVPALVDHKAVYGRAA